MKENSKYKLIDIRPAVWISLIVLLAGFFVLYKTDIANMLKRWNEDDFSYCYLVPFVFLYIVYIKADVMRSLEQKSSFIGLLMLFISGIIFIAGRQGSLETLTYLSIWLSMVSLFFIVFGMQMIRKMVFPLVLLAFIVPVPHFLNNIFTFKLKLISSALSVKMMQLTGISVFREGNIIDLGITQLQVVDACSGLRYVYPLVFMGFIFAYLFHKKWWEKIVIILATIPISVLSNALRIAITGYLMVNVSPELAEGFFHGFSGWLIFMASFVILAILSLIMRRIGIKNGVDTPAPRIKPKGENAVINFKNVKLYCLWFATLILLCFWGINSIFNLSTITPERKTFENFPTQIGDWEGKNSYLSPEILEELWADDYVQISFNNRKTGNFLLFFVPYYDYQKNRHTAHAPAACLVGSGYAPVKKGVIARDFPSGKEKIGQMILEKDNQRLLSNFWFQGRGRIVASEYLNKWYLFWDSIAKRRTDGALVRIELPMKQGQSVEDAQKIVDDFTREIMEILPEYLPE